MKTFGFAAFAAFLGGASSASCAPAPSSSLSSPSQPVRARPVSVRPTAARSAPARPKPVAKVARFVSLAKPLPAFQLPLLQNSDFARGGQNWWSNDIGRVKATYVPVANAPFAQAVRFELTPQAGDQAWSALFTQGFGSALRAGDEITLRFWARSPQSLKLTANFEEREVWTKFVSQEIALSPTWKEYVVRGKAEKAYARQSAQLNIFLGAQTGTIELANVRATRPIFAPDTKRARGVVPAGGVSVLGDTPLEQVGGEGSATATVVDVQGRSFGKALRAETLKRTPNEWDFQVGAYSQTDVKKGDVLFATFWARALKGQPETGEARLTMQFQTGAPDWEKSITASFGVPSAWKKFEVPFEARRDMKAGWGFLAFPLGAAPQSIEIADFRLQNFGSRVAVESLPRTTNDYAGQEENAPWRKVALQRIERIRKGDLTLLVRDAKGKPVQNALVEVRQTRSAFPFGTAVASDFLLAQGDDADRYREHVKRLYSRVGIENHLKWPYWEAWARADALKSLGWLREQNIEARGHVLIWPGWSNLPDDLPKIKDDKAALQRRVSAHFADVLRATKGQVVEWDVVNEPYSNRDLLNILGRDAMVGWFKKAKQLEPNAPLFINDYPPLDGAARANEHLNTYDRDIAMLIRQGAPLEGIGFQCHFGSNVVPPERVLSGLDRFARFKKPIAITEFDMDTPDDDLQARYMRDFLIAAYSHPSVDSIMMWGFWESKHWLPNAALYRTDWSIKPAGQVWLDLVKGAWQTELNATTNARGALQSRGFLGDYEVKVTLANGKSQTEKFTLRKNSAPVVVRFAA